MCDGPLLVGLGAVMFYLILFLVVASLLLATMVRGLRQLFRELDDSDPSLFEVLEAANRASERKHTIHQDEK